MGILAGWWQWSDQSAPDCIYVVVDTGDELDQALHQSQTRRDARSPILLSEGEIVQGYSDSGEEFSSFVAGNEPSDMLPRAHRSREPAISLSKHE